MAKRVQAGGSAHRVRGSHGRAKQNESQDRARSDLDGAAPASASLVRPHLVGLTVYKMTGSGNDFVMLDGRVTTPDDWTVADIRSVCARGTGIGADGLVFVSPSANSSQPGARMVYFNSDGSRAAMCGNAALCSTRFAALLAIAPPALMRLETDAAPYDIRCTADGERAERHVSSGPAPTGQAVRRVPGTLHI